MVNICASSQVSSFSPKALETNILGSGCSWGTLRIPSWEDWGTLGNIREDYDLGESPPSPKNPITIWGLPKLVVPSNYWVFLLKMSILGCEMGVPPCKETPISTHQNAVSIIRSLELGHEVHGSADLALARLACLCRAQSHEVTGPNEWRESRGFRAEWTSRDPKKGSCGKYRATPETPLIFSDRNWININCLEIIWNNF